MTPEFQTPEEDLQTELAYLAHLLGQRPKVAPIVMHRLGAIGIEARIDVERLKAARKVKLKAPVPLPRRRQALARVAAAMVIVVSAPALGGKAANAAELVVASGETAIVAEAPVKSVVIRVMDSGSGKPLPGVKIKTVADEIIATTDAHGQATVPPEFSEESVLSLEHDGYPMVLVEGSRLSARSLITMRKFADVGDVGLAVKPRAGAKKPAATNADDPAERLYRMAVEHSTPKRDAAPKPLLAAKPAPAVPAAPVLAPPPAVAFKPAAPKPAAPVVAARPALTPDEAVIVIPAKPQIALQKPAAPVNTERATKRVVKGNATAKASRSVAVAWTEPSLPQRPVRATKAPERFASADEKAPRAIRLIERNAEVSDPTTTATGTPESPLGLGKDELAWMLPPSASQSEAASAPALVASNPIAAFQAPHIPAIPRVAPAAPKPAARAVKAPVNLAMPPAAVAAVHAANSQVASLPGLPKAPELPKQLREALPKPHHAAPLAPVNPISAPVAQVVKEIRLPVSPAFNRKKPALEALAAVAKAPQPAPVAAVRSAQAAVREVAHDLTYRVKAGDNLSTIALRELGSAALWPVLYNANRDKLTNPAWLPIGTSLDVPRTSGAIAAHGASSYVVLAGDTLSDIAREQFGDVRKWPQIFAANRHMIKNPWLIFPGQRLVIPSQIATGISDSWANLSASAAPPSDGPSGASSRFGHAD